jgi:PIN domain nuclease of toxin-antitoxin system
MKGRYLVDTNIFLWAWHEPNRLPSRYLSLLASEADFLVSVASIWEVSMKAAAGKLETVENVSEALASSGYGILPVVARHAEAVRRLPPHHGDPFDRLIIAQAQIEGLTLVATDRRFAAYDLALA